MSTYRYRLIQASWGISIEIHANIETSYVLEAANDFSVMGWSKLSGLPQKSAPDRKVKLSDQLQYLSEEERQYLQKGLELVSRQLPSNLNVVVVVDDLSFNETDHQPEGLALALAGLLRQHFNLPNVQVPVRYLPEQNRYHFDFEHMKPASA